VKGESSLCAEDVERADSVEKAPGKETIVADKKNDQLIVAYFDSKDQAEQAADSLKSWDKASEDIKLGALAVVSKNDKGKVETTKLGPRNTGKGAAIGVIAGAAAGLLSGGLTIVGGALLGGILGGGAGALTKQGIGLSQEDMDRMSSELDGGHAALLVMADADEVADTTAELTRLGGRAQASEVAPEAVAQAEQALSAAPAATETAAPDAPAASESSPADTATPPSSDTPQNN
jgi:uncharacterized membrane protein